MLLEKNIGSGSVEILVMCNVIKSNYSERPRFEIDTLGVGHLGCLRGLGCLIVLFVEIGCLSMKYWCNHYLYNSCY